MNLVTNYPAQAEAGQHLRETLQEMLSPNKELVISFSDDGTVESMTSDAFPLDFLGRQSVRRATEIVFNEQNQNWEISLCLYDGDGKLTGYHTPPEAKGFKGYDLARAVEVKWLNLCRVYDKLPQSEDGRSLLELAKGLITMPPSFPLFEG